MIKKFFQILFCVFFFNNAFSQRAEFGPFVGGSYYIGDLNPKKHFLLTKPAAGAIYRYNFNPRFAFKGNVYFGEIAGDDKKSGYRPERNLSFKSGITEFSTQIEFNFFPFITGNKNYIATFYVFGGLSMFRFNPKASFNGQWYPLQPLGTEGQGSSAYPERKPYSLLTFSTPFGAGIKFNVMKGIAMGVEYGLRRTFTDYLDDVSTTYANPVAVGAENGPVAKALSDRSEPLNQTGIQRGNSKNKDWYSFVGAFVSIRLKLGRERCLGKPKRNFFEYQSK
ncbi:MAG: DUF6089 family protein [Bacteroidales bacterium]|nr:DUF6089 family protein [Bacteroidales bacterium]